MVGENYVNTFGGENVSPANLSYIAYTISTPVDLTWAFEAVSANYVTADKIDINSTLTNATVRMPPADQVTVGQDALFGNIGTQPYVVTDFGGNVICVVASGIEWFIYLTDNNTQNGVWRAVQFGASTSSANAAALAGAGLRANLTKLDQNLVAVHLTASYTILDGDRAKVIQNSGGNVIYTFPDASVVGNGWFVYVINAGDGNIALTPIAGQTIDGGIDKSIAPGESLAVLSDGVNYHTLGYGRLLASSITSASIPVGGPAGTVVLSATQVAAQIQDFSGVLTGNRRIEYGGSLGYWFVYNNTTPLTPYTMTMAATSADTGVIVPQGAFSIIRSNGTSMAVAFSGAVGTVTSVATTSNMIGGPITTTGTLDLSNTGVTAAIYGATGPPIKTPVLGIDGKGRVTTASEVTLGSGAGLNTGTAPGNIPVIGADGNLPSQIGAFATGDIVYSIATVKPGWIIANSGTVGNAASGAWGRANADTQSLFTLLWSAPAAQFPMYSSVTGGSVPVGRGASASADFSANCQISVPDLRGTVIAGLDNAGGVGSAGRISSYVASTTMGGRGGAQSETVNINIPQLFLRIGYWASPNQTSTAYGTVAVNLSGTTAAPPDYQVTDSGGSGAVKNWTTHTHDWGSSGTFGMTWSAASFGAYGLSDAVYNTGYDANNAGTQPANNVQPTLTMNPWIKL